MSIPAAGWSFFPNFIKFSTRVTFAFVFLSLCTVLYLFLTFYMDSPPINLHISHHYPKLSRYSSDMISQPPLFTQPHYKLVVLILSGAGYAERRTTVRATWVTRVDHDNIAYFFMCFSSKSGDVRRSVHLEAEKYQDIVIFSAEDNYSNLTVHTISALEWANSQLSFDFVMKTDDDSLLNVESIITELMEKSNISYAGYIVPARRCVGGRFGNWVAQNGHKGTLNNWAHGAGYVLAQELVPRLLSHTTQVGLIPNEDV